MKKPPDPLSSSPQHRHANLSHSSYSILASINSSVSSMDLSNHRCLPFPAPRAGFPLLGLNCRNRRSCPLNGVFLCGVIANLVVGGPDLPLCFIVTLSELIPLTHSVRFSWSPFSRFFEDHLLRLVFKISAIKGEMRWSTPPLRATSNGYDTLCHAAVFVSKSEAVSRCCLPALLPSSPGVLLSFSFIMLMYALLPDLCGETIHDYCGLIFLTFVDLFNWVFDFPLLYSIPSLFVLCVPMSSLSPRSPLSFSSESNADSHDLQDPLPATHSHAQPPSPPVLDGVRPHCLASPSEPSRATFASTLKLGLGSHGSSKVSISEPESSSKHGISKSPGIVLIGEPSNQNPLPPLRVLLCSPIGCLCLLRSFLPVVFWEKSGVNLSNLHL